MNGSNNLNYDVVDEHASDLIFIHSNLVDILENVERAVRNMNLSESWVGQSHESYSQNFNDLYENSQNLCTEVKNASDYLKSVVYGYKNIDEQVKKFDL